MQYGLEKQNPRNTLSAHESRTREIKHDTVTQQTLMQPWLHVPKSEAAWCDDWMALSET